jgi:hypothetical protein
MVKLLLKYGARGPKSLHIAAGAGNVELAKLLVEHVSSHSTLLPNIISSFLLFFVWMECK